MTLLDRQLRARGSPPAPGHAPPRAAHAVPERYDERRNAFGAGDRLIVDRVKKTFKKRMVVKGVSVNLKRGESVGLLGPNGAGKTTVFYMITGLIKPDEGSVHIDGFDVTKLSMYRRARLGIGYLPQEASIFRGLSVEDNIMSVLEVTEPNKRERKR